MEIVTWRNLTKIILSISSHSFYGPWNELTSRCVMYFQFAICNERPKTSRNNSLRRIHSYSYSVTTYTWDRVSVISLVYSFLWCASLNPSDHIKIYLLISPSFTHTHTRAYLQSVTSYPGFSPIEVGRSTHSCRNKHIALWIVMVLPYIPVIHI